MYVGVMYMISVERQRINVTIDREMKERAEKEAKRLGISLSGYVSVSIAEKLKMEDTLDVMDAFKKFTEMVQTTQQNKNKEIINA